MTKNRTIQLYRGTTAQNNAYTGSAGELTMDTTTNELRLHDGSTVGGHIIGSGTDMIDYVVEKQEPTAENNYTWYRKYASGFVEQGGYVDGNYSHTFSGTYMSSYTATTITLPVEMDNTNVNIYCNSTVGPVVASGSLSSSTALKINLASANYTASGVDVSWQVSGMAAN